MINRAERYYAERCSWLIRVKAGSHLNGWLKDYFRGLDINDNPDGTSEIEGHLPDLAAVYGLILRLRDSGIALETLWVKRMV